jgi:hypothetical protein
MNISYYRNEDQKYIGCTRNKFIHHPLRRHLLSRKQSAQMEDAFLLRQVKNELPQQRLIVSNVDP